MNRYRRLRGRNGRCPSRSSSCGGRRIFCRRGHYATIAATASGSCGASATSSNCTGLITCRGFSGAAISGNGCNAGTYRGVTACLVATKCSSASGFTSVCAGKGGC